MSLHLVNLDPETRALMLDEIALDISTGELHMSSRLTPAGEQAFPELLRQAVTSHDDAWLAQSLRTGGYLKTHETRQKPGGGQTKVKVPVTAAETLAEGEFNRLYMRAVCERAMKLGISEVVVYRAKPASKPNPESEALVGGHLPVRDVLDRLTYNTGADTGLGLGNPNSGLSVRLP